MKHIKVFRSNQEIAILLSGAAARSLATREAARLGWPAYYREGKTLICINPDATWCKGRLGDLGFCGAASRYLSRKG